MNHLTYIIDHYLSNHKTYYTITPFLLEQQHHLFCLTTILTAHHTYRLSNHALQERLLEKIHSLIKQDPFFKLIKTMTSDQFAKLIKGKQGVPDYI